jgi:hydroxymethylpyrimidine pyrophosphatase-like HAD family hydrolase
VHAIVLVDLDDTLFQTLRKCPPDVPEGALTALGFGRDGGALGFATPRQAAFLSWLGEAALVVPVTGRSHDALSRVRIPYKAAVCAHGGVILDEGGGVDAGWAAEIAARAAPHKAKLAALAEAAQGTKVTARILAEGGTGLYLLLKDPDGDETLLDPLLDRIAPLVPADWTIHRNGNNAALMPPFLGKAHAVRALLPRLRARHPDAPVIGIGDSLSDAPFMALCDYAMMPAGSQLSASTIEALAS